MRTVKRKSRTGAFKAKVGLEAIRAERTVNEIGQAYGVHPAQVRQWSLAVSRQCGLAGVSRSWVHAPTAPEVDARDLMLLWPIDEPYTRRPFYGSRRVVVHLREQGHVVNRKHVQRLMRILGLAGMAPGPATSRPHPEHKVHPHLLRGLSVVRPHQVWSTDITYIRMEGGFAYLVAIID
jgi:putative transposase